jgi:hypothetical protein
MTMQEQTSTKRPFMDNRALAAVAPCAERTAIYPGPSVLDVWVIPIFSNKEIFLFYRFFNFGLTFASMRSAAFS